MPEPQQAITADTTTLLDTEKTKIETLSQAVSDKANLSALKTAAEAAGAVTADVANYQAAMDVAERMAQGGGIRSALTP